MKPGRRCESLVVQDLPEEVLVYDLQRHRAFCLGKNISWIWRQCTGHRTPKQMADALGKELGVPVGEDVVDVALHRLARARLLSSPIPPMPAAPHRSRRELLRRVGVVGGLSILAISSPTAGQAATCLPAGTCVSSHCMDAGGRVCCSGSNACRQNSMACGTGQQGFQCT
jgi:hypothetical protein